MFYSPFGDFEIGVPLYWAANIVNGSYVATSPNSGAYITCSVTETDIGISEMSQFDYASIVGQTRPQLLITMYSNAGNSLTVEAGYVKNGVEWRLMHCIYFSGSYLYEFSLDCPTSAYETDGQAFMTVVTLFRTF